MWLFEMGLSFNLRWWFVALCSDNGEKCSAGKENPAAAAACNDCSNAAECSWALRRSSATELERGSVLADVGDNDDEAEDVVGGFIGQQEHRPGKAKYNKKIIKLIIYFGRKKKSFAFLAYVFFSLFRLQFLFFMATKINQTKIHYWCRLIQLAVEHECQYVLIRVNIYVGKSCTTETLLKYTDCYQGARLHTENDLLMRSKMVSCIHKVLLM